MWNDLTMAQKNELMKTYIKGGVTSLDDMKSHYNLYALGGPKKTYKEWVSAMASKYPWLELNSQKAGYDYERYFNENYDDALQRLIETEPRHFTDKYKLPSHPTFSNESVYSTPKTRGGTWVGDDMFMPSAYNAERYPWLKPYKPVTEDYIYSFKNGGHLFAKGGNPDWDPEHPYHYHTSNGEKVVVTEEDWNKYKDDPSFRKIRAAVEAEQRAYPNPEYEVNPQFVSDLRSTYKPAQNYSNYASSLPKGYSFTSEGLITDSQGNYYVQSDFKQSPRFTYDASRPLNFTIEAGRPVQRNITFYPVNMEKRIKPSIPVTRTMNVSKKKEEAINKVISNNTKKYLPPISYITAEDEKNPFAWIYVDKNGEPKIHDIIRTVEGEHHPYSKTVGSKRQFQGLTRENLADYTGIIYPHLHDSIDAKEYNKQVDLIKDLISHEEWFPGIYLDNLTHVADTVPNKQKALKKAVIEVEEPTIKLIKKNGGKLKLK